MNYPAQKLLEDSWYVIKTKPQKEGLVCQQLNQIDFETFCPKVQKFGSRKSLILQALFPSYAFVKAPLEDPSIHRLVRFTRGVSYILGAEHKPVPISSEAVDIIKSNLNQEGHIEMKTLFQPGKEVRLKRGVFKDLIGILEKPVSAAGRIRVLLKIWNREVSTTLHCSMVEPIH
jgi:transcription antitermination factor NusG